MSENENNGRKQLFDILGGLIAIVLLACYAMIIVDTYIDFIPSAGTFADIVGYILKYAPLALVIVVGCEVVSTRSFVLRIVVYAVCAVVVLFQFFPDVYSNLAEQIGLSAI